MQEINEWIEEFLKNMIPSKFGGNFKCFGNIEETVKLSRRN